MGKSSGEKARDLTPEELSLIGTQETALQDATNVYMEEFNLSQEDRDYFAQMYRGDLDPNDPVVKAEVAKRLEATPAPTREQFESMVTTTVNDMDGGSTTTETEVFDDAAYDKALSEWQSNKDSIVREVSSDLGSKGVDELLFDAVKKQSTDISTAFDSWQSKANELGSNYIKETSGLSEGFANSIQAASDAMGTADADLLAQTTGQNMAGISQAYSEGRNQLAADLAQRGIQDSGVGISALSNMYSAESMQKAGASSNAYQQAITASDSRRMTQLGMGESIYGLQSQQANLGYGITSGLQTSELQNSLNAGQQNIANLQMTSGVSQGVIGNSQNYLFNAGSTAGNVAGTAGSTALGIGNTQANYASAQAQAAATQTAGLYSAAGMAAGMYFGGPTGAAAGSAAGKTIGSDFRFKNNIKFVQEEAEGIRMYTWEWNDFAIEYLGEDKLYIPYGVIAQELEKTHPEYVFIDDNGYYFVDYEGLKDITGGL